MVGDSSVKEMSTFDHKNLVGFFIVITRSLKSFLVSRATLRKFRTDLANLSASFPFHATLNKVSCLPASAKT